MKGAGGGVGGGNVVEGGEDWITNAVHVGDGDPSCYWPDIPRPEGEQPERMKRFVGGFDGND